MSNIVIRSERDAWDHVKRICASGQRRGASAEDLQAGFIEIDAIADTILSQLYEGIHRNPRRKRNPPAAPVYESPSGRFSVYVTPKGTYEVFRHTSTHAERVAQIGFSGQGGLNRAIAEIERREAR